MVLGPPRKLSVVVSRNRKTMEWRKTFWLACKVQTERISCLLPSMQLWLQSGTRWAEWHYQTFCHWKHRTQPMLPATFFVRQDVFITKDTSCQEIRCKEGCKITKKKPINRQHQSKVKISSFIYQKNSPFKGYQIFSKRILKCCASVKKA